MTTRMLARSVPGSPASGRRVAAPVGVELGPQALDRRALALGDVDRRQRPGALAVGRRRRRSAGRSTTNSAPPSGASVRVTMPLCSVTRSRTIASPRPVPPGRAALPAPRR